ncbi:periplasmic copper chaperone A [Mariprofundus micogutta]|uniref:Periplasmic copper chaperone A n=1 Tax=Mariprofundus micogutta TaxID=1921010 RepID=A0A1L8CQW6_9PROT|nr:copper chaperone PCu(A)C [Mariprofundus micogutta]GAV21315.1 periplasmic copper chaperone A [Mariprofundus micogutta]
MKIKVMILTALMLLLPSLAAAEITVEKAWVRMPPPVADTAAGYMVMRNSGDQDVEIKGITTDAAKQPEFHSTSEHNGMVHMMKMDKVIVPAHGELHFGTGGNHLMLIGLTGELKSGAHVMMTLETAAGEKVMVHAEVRDLRDTQENMDHSGHGQHHGH